MIYRTAKSVECPKCGVVQFLCDNRKCFCCGAKLGESMKKIIAVLFAVSLQGCAAVGGGGWLLAHQGSIAAVGVAAGATAAITSTAVNVITLENDAKAAQK